MLVVALHAIFWSPKFPHSSTSERPLHLLSSLWLPLPYLTLRGEDRGEEMPQLWFLLSLHFVENVSMLVASRVYYLHEGYPTAILVCDVTLLLSNLFGLLLLWSYHKYIALYSNIRSTPPPSNLPSYGPEVRAAGRDSRQVEDITGWFQEVDMVPEGELVARRGQEASGASPPAGQVGGMIKVTAVPCHPTKSSVQPCHPGDAGARRGDGDDHNPPTIGY